MLNKHRAPLSPLKLEVSKKTRLDHEWIKDKENQNHKVRTRIKPKTTYFFQPTNTLATDKAIEEEKSDENLKNCQQESTENHLATEVGSVGGGNDAIKSVQHRSNSAGKSDHGKFETVLPELQSSDDSFDGIRWKTSPRGIDQRSNELPSSPLKRHVFTAPAKDRNPKSSSTVVNAQADSVLYKYGAGLQNIIPYTPRIKRTQSDMLSSDSMHKRMNMDENKSVSPPLHRTKSSGMFLERTTSHLIKTHNLETGNTDKPFGGKYSRNKDSTLNNWLQRFDKNSPDTQEKQLGQKINRIVASTKTLEVSQKAAIGEEKVEHQDNPVSVIHAEIDGVDFSDDFSDSGLVASSDGPSFEKGKPEGSDSDPFSSDDEKIISQIYNASAKKRESATNLVPELLSNTTKDKEESNPNTEPEATHEGTSTQQRLDLKYAEDFRNDIKRIESIQAKGNKYDDSKSIQNEVKLSFSREDLIRYQIKDIFHTSFKIDGLTKQQLILTVSNPEVKQQKLIVRGEYLQLDFQMNDIIHMIITDATHPKLIDDNHNLLIWNPDILVSATTVSQQMSCSRKTVLHNRFSFPGESSYPLIIGDILHEIFQFCFLENNWSTSFMNQILETELKIRILEIYSLGDAVEKVRSEVAAQLPYLHDWFDTYFKADPRKNTSIPTNQRNTQVSLIVNKALDIEENIWSPMFGMKGKVDVTIETQLHNNVKNGTYLVPMEIKTGREYISHHAQSSLYSLLFKDRYNLDVSMFLLVYTKEKLSKMCDISPTDLKSLVNLRNRITKYLKPGTRELPDVIRQLQCDRCEVLHGCMTLHNLVEDGFAEESGLPEGAYELMTSHIDSNSTYRNFYNYWDDLITQEEGKMMSLKKDLWILTSEERETSGGKALSNLKIREFEEPADSKEMIYTFERHQSSFHTSLQNSQLSKYDRVVVSDEQGHFAIAQGFIVAIRPSFIRLSLNRRIVNSHSKLSTFNSVNNQTFESVLSKTQNSSGHTSEKSYRIDKDDMFHGMGLARFNILNLFTVSGDARRRELIVDLKQPSFKSLEQERSRLDPNLNTDQAKAVEKVLHANDYALILGMPGTGKTTVIAQLIRRIVNEGKSVLLASYTHSAVDNILLKLLHYDIDILRIGSVSKVHRDIKRFVPGSLSGDELKSYKQFQDIYMRPQVVATTCLGIGDIAFNLRKEFDYCIVDEASQVSMPVNLGPLRFCDKFVLVGDHNQLPPLVQHPDPSVRQGLSRSLFKILGEAYPHAVAELTYQYRMCEDIMLLSNLLIYDGKLKCGSDKVAQQSLHIPNTENLSLMYSPKFATEDTSRMWMNWVFEPKNKVIFLNHDKVPGYERCVGEKIENLVEVDIATQIVEALSICGVSEENIGVMSLYRSQLRLLHRSLSNRPNIEVLTADQFQGRDKDCIIISLVRSNKDGKVGDLLKEWRRVNVAITRSKSKLILLGSKETLKSVKMLEAFVKLIECRGWMYNLPCAANEYYLKTFEDRNVSGSPKSALSQRIKVDSKVINRSQVLKDIVNGNT